MNDSSIYMMIGLMVMVAAYVKFIMLPKHALKIKIEEREKHLLVEEKKFTPVIKQDFYGTDELLNDPSGFTKKAIEMKDKLSKGDEISVNAVQAFYLIRNFEHHNLIVGETGSINFKTLKESSTFDDDKLLELQERIIQFEKDDGSEKYKFNTPEYVKEVLPLKDGGVRWVFTEEHAKWCGIASQCFDKFDRAMPDPDAVIEDPKSKSREKFNTPSQQNDATKDLSKKLTRMIEMEEERRVDVMLENSKTFNTDTSRNNEVKETTTLAPAQYVDDVELLAAEHAIPDFEMSFDDEPETTNLTEELSIDINHDEEQVVLQEGSINNSLIESYAEESHPLENPDEESMNDFLVPQKFEYESLENLSMLLAHNKNYFEFIMSRVFSSKGQGYVFIDFDNNHALIEKNYFARTLREMVEQSSLVYFDKELLSIGAVGIYDGNKINTIANAMDASQKFQRFGRGNSQTLWNMLFSSIDVDDLYISGWFLKMNIDDSDFITEYISKHSRGSSVEMISSTPKDIKSRIKNFQSVKMFY